MPSSPSATSASLLLLGVAAALSLAAHLRRRLRRRCQPRLSELMHSLTPGKHPEVRLTVSGAVEPSSVRAVSKRLVFFRVNAADEQIEALVKHRDGCLDEAEIAQLVQRLSSAPAAVRFHGFPEVSDENGARSASLHVVQITIADATPLVLPVVAREPVAEPAGAGGAGSNMSSKYKKSGSHFRPNTASRHQQFVAWLIETYGLERLKSGAGVLDVAGGAGGVAFELAFRRGIPCVVVDPRPMRLNGKQKRALKNRANSQAVLGQAEPPPNASWWLGGDGASAPQALAAAQSEPQLEPEAAAAALPQPQAAVTEEAADDAPAAAAALAAPAAAAAAAAASAEAMLVCQGCEEPSASDAEIGVPASYEQAWREEGLPTHCLPRQICGLFDEGFAHGAHAALWRDCSVVVGMHPDQATEPVVRAALAAGKPFAVVPCCVFPKSNTHRRLADGKPVSTTDEFCAYLEGLGAGAGAGEAQGRAGACRRTELSTLSFEGKNTIVWGAG